MSKPYSKLLALVKDAKSNRSNHDIVYQDINKYVIPDKSDFNFTKEDGTITSDNQFDITAPMAHTFLTSTLYNGLTNPQQKWFRAVPTKAFRGNRDANEYADRFTEILWDVFSSPRTGFNQQNWEATFNFTGYGMAAMFIIEDPDNDVAFHSREISEIYVRQNSKGTIDTVYREFKMTPRQAAQQWGEDKLVRNIKRKLEQNNEDESTYWQIIMPRKDAEKIIPKEVSKVNKKFKVIQIDISEEKTSDSDGILNVTGYRNNPLVVPRFDRRGTDPYGRGPAWKCMRTIKLINTMEKVRIRAAQKTVSPPWGAAHDGVTLPLKLVPDGVNMGAVNEDGKQLIVPLLSNTRIDIGDDQIRKKSEQIFRCFFADQFLEAEGKTPLSATEVLARRQDSRRLMGPHIENLIVEYLTPLVERVINILEDKNRFPDVPTVNGNPVELEIEFIGPLAKIDTSESDIGIIKTLTDYAPLLQVMPELLDNLKMDDKFRDSLISNGVSFEFLEEPEVRDGLRQSRAEQAQSQQTTETAAQVADSVANLKKAGVDIDG